MIKLSFLQAYWKALSTPRRDENQRPAIQAALLPFATLR